MTEQKDIKIRRKPRPKQNPNNQENASNKNKKRRWKKHHKKPKKDLGESLQKLQEHFNGEFHAP